MTSYHVNHRWRRFGMLFLKVAISVYVLVLILLITFENSLLYPAPKLTDGDWNPVGFKHEDVDFRSVDGTSLHGWYAEHEHPQCVLLICHGNGEHVAWMVDEIEVLRNQYQASVFVFDYRGYGKSQGKPFEKGILEDGEAALHWLCQRTGLSPNGIVLYGRSLGGGVAVHLAAKLGSRGLVLDRTFSSLVDVAGHHFKWLPVRLLMRNRYPSLDKIQDYTGPILQMHGRTDEVIPFRFGKLLFDAAPTPNEKKTFLEFPRLNHNDPQPAEFTRQLGTFLKSLPNP